MYLSCHGVIKNSSAPACTLLNTVISSFVCSRYLDDLLNIDNPYFEGMVNQNYPPELQLNKANTSDTEAPFLDLHLSISNGFVSSKIYDPVPVHCYSITFF